MRQVFCFCLVIIHTVTYAQRDDAYDLLEDFTLNPAYFTSLQNPALTGVRGWLNVNATFTNYQPQVPFSDYDYSLSFGGRIRELAFGFNGYHRAFGDQRSTDFHLAGSRIWVTDNGLLTVGAAVTNTSKGFINKNFAFQDEIDPFHGFVKPSNQPEVLSGAENLSLSLGASWLYKNLYLSSSLLRGVKVLSIYDDNVQFFDDRGHLFPLEWLTTVGYRYKLSSSFSVLGIAEIQKGQYSGWSFSPAVNLSFKNMLFIGASYQDFNEWELEAGVRIVDHMSILVQMGFPDPELADEYITPTYYRFGLQANL